MSIVYTTEPPRTFEQLSDLYESLGWNSLGLTAHDLEKMCSQSWYALYAFHERELIGMGRVVSDGVITGIICGLCVSPNYQSKGIGKELLHRIMEHCEKHRVIPQLMCANELTPYYEAAGFRKFTVGMTKDIVCHFI
ncbi:GNAT family N-acetyltransferase [Bacillus sp. Hm123]|uniref:GNAT family N-acetyltransferase n=1 Tax=Bacillus sp. Hm123 TaxID=3450745 RepID=UPI003F434646